MQRPLAKYIGLLLATIALGLATRLYPRAFPNVVAEFGGDVLWAMMVFWLLVLWRRGAGTVQLAVIALAFAAVVEVSQLYHAPWIDSVRATRVGALLLGHGFLWSDLACYAVGVALAASLDAGVARRSPVLRPP